MVVKKMIEDMCYYLNRYDRILELSEEEAFNTYEGLKDSMFIMLRTSIKKANIHDTFEYYYYFGPSIFIEARSAKTKTTYRLGFDFIKRELFFATCICNSYNLKNLQDAFLCDFFTIMDKYKFIYVDYQPNECRSKYPDMFKHFKGYIFRMMRSYFMQVSEGCREDFGLGDLEAIWNSSRSMDEIYTELCIATKWFYKFNYQLWKIEDLKKFKNK